jgi:hypothetical protein
MALTGRGFHIDGGTSGLNAAGVTTVSGSGLPDEA